MAEKKLISWNVNGIRACIGKGFSEAFAALDADILCLQETKVQAGQVDFAPEGYHCYWNYAEKKGYSGTAVFSREEPLSVSYGIGIPEHDREGRVITLGFENFYFVCVYTPNSQDARPARLQNDMGGRVQGLSSLARQGQARNSLRRHECRAQRDRFKNPKTNRKNPGFTDEERSKMTELLSAGFTDTFRYFYPDAEGQYSWWSYRFKSRERNTGWRIDYFLCSERLNSRLTGAKIHQEIFGSDHCPVELTVDI